MAIAFFGDYLDPVFRGRSHQEENEIFERLGLTSAFWKV